MDPPSNVTVLFLYIISKILYLFVFEIFKFTLLSFLKFLYFDHALKFQFDISILSFLSFRKIGPESLTQTLSVLHVMIFIFLILAFFCFR